LVLVALFGLNGLYFLLTPASLCGTNTSQNLIDLSLSFYDKTITFLIPPAEKSESSADNYDRWIEAACGKHSLDPALVKAIIRAESQFDPLAVSPRGAIGLMQIAPVTIKELGIKDPFNPKTNIDGGVRYLKDLLDAFEGNQELALAAYNAGPTQVLRHNGVPPFKETRDYLQRVLRYTAYYQKNKIS
jgi:soluble lytic murein transglycosylase-like protein